MMALPSRFLRCGLLLGAFTLCVAARAGCELKPLVPQGDIVRTDNLTIALGEADNPAKPTAWQGPVAAGSCTLDLGIIEPPLMLASGRFLYVPTYSGSVRTLYLIDPAACTILWKSREFSGQLNIGPKALILGGQRIILDGKCVPVTVQPN